MAQGTGGSPSNIEKHLKGVNYPASKNDLVQAAQRNNAPNDIMTNIRNLREERFSGPQDVMKAFGTGQQGQQGHQGQQNMGQERMGGNQNPNRRSGME